MKSNHDRFDSLTEARSSMEEPTWVKAIYGCLCPCLLKQNLIQEKDHVKAMILDKNPNTGESSTVYGGNFELCSNSNNANQSPRTENGEIVVEYEPSFYNRDRKNSQHKSTVLLVNSKINEMDKNVHRSLIGT